MKFLSKYLTASLLGLLPQNTTLGPPTLLMFDWYNNSVATFSDQNNKNPNDGYLVRSSDQ